MHAGAAAATGGDPPPAFPRALRGLAPRAALSALLLALAAQAAAATAVVLATCLYLAASGHDALTLASGASGRQLLAGAFGVATACALVLVSGRARRLRPATVALALLLVTAWPLSGHALPGAVLATAALGLATARDRLRPGALAIPPVPAAAALGLVSVALVIAGLSHVKTRDLDPARGLRPAAAERHLPPAGGAARTSAPRLTSAAGAHGATRPPAGTTSPRSGASPAGTAATAPGGGVTSLAAGTISSPRDDATSPAEVVAAYYRALDGRRFAEAWKWLSPAVRQAFGGFAKWRAGFATTLSSRPGRISVVVERDATYTLRHVLVARDRVACGATVEQRFSVSWRLVGGGGAGWSARALRAAALGRPARRSPCA